MRERSSERSCAAAMTAIAPTGTQRRPRPAPTCTKASSGDAANWQLQLKPRDSRLARRMPSIEVDGANGEPRCFRTHEGDGDLAILLVDALASQKLPTRVGRAEVDALCRGAKKP